MTAQKWAVFDLDETIIDHDTFGKYLVHLLLRQRWRAVIALAVLPVAGPMSLTRRWKARGASILLWIATVGVSEQTLTDVVNSYVQNLEVRRRCYREALAEIQRLMDNGTAVAVVTASAEVLARPICAEIDHRIVVLGSKLTRRAGGLVANYHCYGPKKVEPVRSLGGQVEAAFGDSRSDLPMLELAEQMILVNANKKLKTLVAGVPEYSQRLRAVQWGTDK